MKKIIIFLITSLILIGLICTFCIANQKLTKEEFISLMKIFENVSNVKLEGSTTKYIKDQYMLSIRDDGLYTWQNSKTKEYIVYSPNLKEYSSLSYHNEEFNNLEDSEYTFIGYEKYNDTKCAVGEFKIADLNLTTRIWIDAQKGTCLKILNTGIDSEGKTYEITDEYTATYDVVTDKDVKKPDLAGYTFVENTMEESNDNIVINDDSNIDDITF